MLPSTDVMVDMHISLAMSALLPPAHVLLVSVTRLGLHSLPRFPLEELRGDYGLGWAGPGK